MSIKIISNPQELVILDKGIHTLITFQKNTGGFETAYITLAITKREGCSDEDDINYGKALEAIYVIEEDSIIFESPIKTIELKDFKDYLDSITLHYNVTKNEIIEAINNNLLYPADFLIYAQN